MRTPTETGRKLFVGPRFRRLRKQLNLSQTQIAEGLGLSPSYINLIERNQRPVTAQMLLRLAETYDLDLRDLATSDEDRCFAELNEILSDPLFRQIDLPKQELLDLAELCPGDSQAFQRVYAAFPEASRGDTRGHHALTLPHHRCELLRGGRDDALSGIPERCGIARLRSARFDAALQCGLRAGLPSSHAAATAERARRAVLPAAGGQCGQRVETIFIRHVSVLEIRRHLPALERAFHLRHT